MMMALIANPGSHRAKNRSSLAGMCRCGHICHHMHFSGVVGIEYDDGGHNGGWMNDGTGGGGGGWGGGGGGSPGGGGGVWMDDGTGGGGGGPAWVGGGGGYNDGGPGGWEMPNHHEAQPIFAPPAPMDQYPSYAEKSLPPEGSPYEKEYPHWSEQEVIDELEEPESIMQLQPMYQPMEEQPLIVLPPAEQPPAYVMAPGAPEPEQGCHCPVTCQNSCNSQCGDCCGYSSQTCISVDCC
eukprot:GHVO01045907.1.p1 GENE.GHVO01045907.1~~GHVO01045907.1.p1  ORF type:complete len:238 (-),score=29.96 GHVO01045907.1:84-797(-)